MSITLTDQIKKSLKSIAEELFSYDGLAGKPGIEGASGLALFFAYYYFLSGEKRFAKKAINLVDFSINHIEHVAGYSLSGLSGIVWVVQHLTNNQFVKPNEKALLRLDQLLEETLSVRSPETQYDLFYGWIGKGIYFLERNPKGKSKTALNKIVSLLYDNADKINGAITWKYVKESNSNRTVYSLGLAHGIPSIIIFLSKVYELRISSDLTETLIKQSVKWLMDQKLQASGESSFKTCVYSPDLPDGDSSRLAWCNGDLGIAVALTQCGKALRSQKILDEALNVALKTCKRKLNNSGVFTDGDLIDPNFCHGLAGIAHIYRRLYAFFEHHELLETNHYWLNELLKSRRDGNGIAGYVSDVWMGYDEQNKAAIKKWDKNPYLLNGTAGVGLVLISFLNDNLFWDKLFFTDLGKSSKKR